MISNAQKRLLDLIAKGESKTVEFKSTISIDLKTGSPAFVIEHSVLTTLAAFLNTEGGSLFIGVVDNKDILGLNADFGSFKGDDKFDEFRKYFDNLFSRIGNGKGK